MKQLKSNLEDLHALFDSIAVRHVAETLQSCRDGDDASQVHQDMGNSDFDVMGIKNGEGTVYGYVERLSLGTGECRKYACQFCASDLISDTTSLIDLLRLLHDRRRVFILEVNRVNGIVTRGDLQKAPTRMFLFGLCTLIEMQLLRLIRGYYDSWKHLLKPKRLEEAEKRLKERKGRNAAIDLADCLQFFDKRDIILKSPQILERVGLGSKSSIEPLLEEAEKLRNKVAHGQDLVKGSKWPQIIDLAGKMERLLERLEKCEDTGIEFKVDNT